MMHQTDLGYTPMAQRRALVGLVRAGAITMGGNGPGRIYGRLNCRAGKRMIAANRVFFRDADEATALGFRPCAVCMPNNYRIWRMRKTA